MLRRGGVPAARAGGHPRRGEVHHSQDARRRVERRSDERLEVRGDGDRPPELLGPHSLPGRRHPSSLLLPITALMIQYHRSISCGGLRTVYPPPPLIPKQIDNNVGYSMLNTITPRGLRRAGGVDFS